MTITPDTPTAPDPDTLRAAADRRAATLITTSVDALTATMAAGMLDTIGDLKKLPTVLFPDIDPEQVQAIFNLGATTGYRAGTRAGRPRWEREELARVQAELAEAGYAVMAALIRKAVAPTEDHPADATGPARGEHR